MIAMVDDIKRMLVRELESFAAEIELFSDDATVWKTMPGISNSAGNLALHVCGNLKHYVGGVLGNTGYVRDREAEFSARSGSRRDLAREIKEAVEVVSAVLPGLTEDTVAATYPEKVAGVSLPCGRFLIHLCAHAGFHLGQAGYLRRSLIKNAESGGGVSLPALSGG